VSLRPGLLGSGLVIGVLLATLRRRSRPSQPPSSSASAPPAVAPSVDPPPGSPIPLLGPGPSLLSLETSDQPARDDSGATRIQRRRRHDWVKKFLEIYRNCGNVRLAAEGAGVSRSAPYLRAQRDPRFKAAWDAAQADAVDLLEGRAWQTALDGDPRMTIFLLKSLRRGVYGDSIEVRVDLRPEAERIAASLGISAEELLERAERIAGGDD
jgi:hypothetical protein